jgi:hypothetical protein
MLNAHREPLALACAELLGIAQAAHACTRGEHDCGGVDGPRERPATRFVDAGREQSLHARADRCATSSISARAACALASRLSSW